MPSTGPFFLRPAMGLMRRLSTSSKIGLLAIATCAALLPLAWAAVQHALWFELACSAAAVAALAYLGLALHASFSQSLQVLQEGIAAIAAGDLAHKVQIEGRDELAATGQVVERMSEGLSVMVAEIRSSAVRVGDAAAGVAGGMQPR